MTRHDGEGKMGNEIERRMMVEDLDLEMREKLATVALFLGREEQWVLDHRHEIVEAICEAMQPLVDLLIEAAKYLDNKLPPIVVQLNAAAIEMERAWQSIPEEDRLAMMEELQGQAAPIQLPFSEGPEIDIHD